MWQASSPTSERFSRSPSAGRRSTTAAACGAHSGLSITHEAYTRTIKHLSGALADLGVEPELVRTIARQMELMRAAIVEVR